MHRLRIATVLATAACLSLVPAMSWAGGTRTLQINSFDDFDRGETEGAAIESSGRVTVGYLPQRGDVKQTTAFSCLPQSRSVLVGTSDKASILRVFPNLSKKAGRSTKPDKKTKKGKKVTPAATLKVETVAELEGVVVSAMTTLPGGDTLAATLPGGKIYRVNKRGAVKVFAELKVDQVWALAVHKGRVLAATGPKGELYSMSASGKDVKVVLDVDEKDILSLATVGNEVVVGTSPSAKIYQVTDDVEGIMLHSFSGNEVRALTVTNRGLFAAVNTFKDRQISSVTALTKSLNRTSLTGQPPSGSRSGERAPNADAKLFHVDLGPKRDLARASEAPWEVWLKRDKQYFTSALQVGADAVLVASSASGKVYRVRGPRDAATVADFEERQTTSLCKIPKGPVFATAAHGGAVYQLRAAVASQAKFRAKVHDARHPARYGAVVVRGDGPLSVKARVGPTEEADRRWSEWKSIKLTKGKDGLRGSLGALAKRRYVELEVTLGNADAALRGVEMFYAPENLAPLIKKVDVKHPKFKAKDKKEPATDVTIRWDVEARDDDSLEYEVRIRPEGTGDKEWVKLTKDDEPLTSPELKLDLTTMPDGIYEVGVQATDEPTNGSANARTDEMVSDPFVVDRQRPSVKGVKVSGNSVTAEATDDGGFIHDAAYSIDGGSYRTAGTKDGLFDNPKETIVFSLPGDLTPGKHRIVVRVRDSFGNIGTAATVVQR